MRNARRAIAKIKRKLVYRLWYRFADCLGTETFADGKNSNTRAERETRAGTFLRPQAAIYARQQKRGKRERERQRKGGYRSRKISRVANPSERPRSDVRPTSNVVNHGRIRYRVSSSAPRGEYLSPKARPYPTFEMCTRPGSGPYQHIPDLTTSTST